MARVGFEETFYRVRENVGTVEICVVVHEPAIDCPIEFDFNVTFVTGDGSAGTYIYCVHFHIYLHLYMLS